MNPQKPSLHYCTLAMDLVKKAPKTKFEDVTCVVPMQDGVRAPRPDEIPDFKQEFDSAEYAMSKVYRNMRKDQGFSIFSQRGIYFFHGKVKSSDGLERDTLKMIPYWRQGDGELGLGGTKVSVKQTVAFLGVDGKLHLIFSRIVLDHRSEYLTPLANSTKNYIRSKGTSYTWDRFCDVCEKPIAKGVKSACALCKARHYCNKECATRDWRQGHKRLCPRDRAVSGREREEPDENPADTDLAGSLAAMSLPASQPGQDLPAEGMAAFTPNRRSPESRDD